MDLNELLPIIIVFVCLASILTIATILINSYIKKQRESIINGEEDYDVIILMHHELDKNVIKRKRITKIIKNIVFYALIVIIAPILIIAIIQKINGDVVMLGDKTIMVVATGSMSYKNEANDYLIENNLNDQFMARDIIVLNKVSDSSELSQYDIIAFVNDKGINVIHRIIKINPDGTYLTKGDANGYGGEDTYNPSFNDVIGKYEGQRIGFLGNIIMFLQSPIGIITIVALLYCLYIFDRYNSQINKACEERINTLNELFKDDFSSSDFDDTKIIDEYTYYFSNKKILGRTKNHS